MKARVWWVLGWVALTVIVVVAIQTVEWRRVLHAIGTADPPWVILALLANAVGLPIATVQWRVLLPRGAAVAWPRMFAIVALTASVSNGAPAPVSLAAAVRLLATRAGLGHARGASVMVMDQLAEGFAKIALITVAAALVPGFEYRTIGLVLLLGVPALALASAALAHRSASIEAWAAGASGAPGRAFRFVSRTIDHLDALRRPGYLALAVGLAVVKKTIEGTAIAMVAAAFGLALPLWVVVSVLAAVNLSTLVAQTPAGLGVWEAAAFLVLQAAGVEASIAVALAIVAHAAYVAPLALTGWLLESARAWSGSRSRVLGLVALAVMGLVIHLWFVLGADALDSDRALVLLMARDFARGALSIYFWQQNYMASVEPLLLTPFAALGWATPVAAGLVAIGLTAALASLSVRLARRLGGTTWMALLVWAVPPAVVVHHHVALYGARLACTLLAFGAFVWSLRCRRGRAWMGVGALAGLAYACDHLMLPWAIAVMFVAGARGSLTRVALGALVPVVLDTACAVATPAVHLAGPNAPDSWLSNVPLLFGTVLPQLFGLLLSRGPGPVFEPPAGIVPGGALWPALAIPGALALALLFATLVRRRRELFAGQGSDEGVATRALLGACVVGLAVFCLVGGGGERWSVRYLVPLWPAVSIFAALAAARWGERWRPLAAAAVLPAVFTLLADPTWPRAGDGAPAREEAADVAEAVRASGARAVWAEYWDAYRMALLVGESPRWVTLRVIERRPDWVREALDASPVAYLVRREDAEVLGILDGARTQGIRRLDDRGVGRYRLVVMERAVPRAVLHQHPPDRGWQRVAALSAGLLFWVTLAAMGLLARVTGPRPLSAAARDLRHPSRDSRPGEPATTDRS